MFKILSIQSQILLALLKANQNKVVIAILIVTITAYLSIFFPFSTYAVSLAIFGVPHVILEIRYLDSRFHNHFGKFFEFFLIQGLLIIAIVRSFCLSGFLTVQFTCKIELCLVLSLVLTATYFLFKQSFKLSLIGLSLSLVITLGILLSPSTTLIIFAILHNLTPIVFITKQFHHYQRKIALRLCFWIFLILPIIVFITRWSIEHDISLKNFAFSLNAFVPTQLQLLPLALPLFSTVTFLQCMHYAIVIGLFSQWTVWKAPTLIQWPQPKYFLMLLLTISTLFLISFSSSFLLTRSFYGIGAVIHAWAEIPLLLMTLIPCQAVFKSSDPNPL